MRAELDARGVAPSPQTRDMNPIYTGKDVSYIDTKQANRDAEDAVLDGERFAVFAGLLGGATYPQAALDKAWVQLAYGAHHDAITGSESDQVYLDLLTGWRDAWELGRAARDNALAPDLAAPSTARSVVWNPLAHKRTDVVTARLDEPLGAGVRVLDADGAEVPALVEHGGRSVSWLARDVPSLGWRAYRLVAGRMPRRAGQPSDGNEIAQRALPAAGRPGARRRGVSSLVDRGRPRAARRRRGRQRAGRVRRVPAHPHAGEGPWHLLPKGPVAARRAAGPSPCRLDGPARRAAGRERPDRRVLRYTQTLTLWHGIDRVDCSTTSTSSPARTGCCGCAGRARCPARCRSARSATPSSAAASG